MKLRVVAQPITPVGGARRLHGFWLTIIRAVWAAGVVLSLVVLAAALPLSAGELRTVCTEAPCGFYLNPEGASALRQLGLSLEFYALYLTVVAGAVALGFFVLAALLAYYRSDDWMALFISLWFVMWGVDIAAPLGLFALAERQPMWHWPVAVLQTFTVFLLLFAYLFPNGKFVPSWTRWLAALWAILMLASSFFPTSLLDPNIWPFSLSTLVLLSFVLSAVFAQVYRYRRVSSPVERQQTKWVVFGFGVLMLVQLVHFQIVLPMLTSGAGFSNPLAVLADATLASLSLLLVSVPIAIAICTTGFMTST